MGWAERSNPQRDRILADRALIRRFLVAHPDRFRELMQATIHKSWADVQAWMRDVEDGKA